MRWKGRERSENVEDRRGMRKVAAPVGCGTFLALGLAVAVIYMGGDPQPLLDAVQNQQAAGPGPGQPAPGVDDETREFIEVVLRDTETVWSRLFRDRVRGGSYRPPKLVIFSGTVRTACGMANARMGPFYCPADQQVYIDPDFFDELGRRHGAPGDFAQAYVIAHEIGHHVQQTLGFNRVMEQVRRTRDEIAINQMSVRYELQADYLAGVWAHHAQNHYDILEQGDIAEAMTAANSIGDDTLQQMAQGYVVPARFTHGTSEQRVRWFRAGLISGDLNGCQQLFEMNYEQL